MSLFPPYLSSTVEFSFLLNSSLDIFEIRQKQTAIDQDLGLLHAVDERLASYGWLTTTGVKFIIILDLVGDQTLSSVRDARGGARSGFRESDLKPVCSQRSLRCFYLVTRSLYRCDSPSRYANVVHQCRPFELYRRHTYSSCRIHSTLQMTIMR